MKLGCWTIWQQCIIVEAKRAHGMCGMDGILVVIGRHWSLVFHFKVATRLKMKRRFYAEGFLPPFECVFSLLTHRSFQGKQKC